MAQSAYEMLGHWSLQSNNAQTIEVVGVANRAEVLTEAAHLPPSAQLITEPAQLAALGPDLVVEAASRQAVASWGVAAVEAGADLIISSTSALAAPELLETLRQSADDNQAQILIQPGALAGIDGLAAARLGGIETVSHRIIKPPRAWRNTPAESLCSLDSLATAIDFFRGSAAETATAFPKNANVAMTTALAGIGPDLTQVTLVADPATTTNQHHIEARGQFGQLELKVSNQPLASNPKTSALAALNLARAITNRVTAVVV